MAKEDVEVGEIKQPEVKSDKTKPVQPIAAVVRGVVAAIDWVGDQLDRWANDDYVHS